MGLTLEQSARRAGGHRWAELRLYEILGGWVPATAEIDAKLMFDRHSAHHAWRASQWWDRLPVVAGMDREGLCQAASAAVAAAYDHLASAPATVTRLAGAYRVALPRLFAAYQDHREQAGAVADGSTLRTLGLVGRDLGCDWQEGERLLETLMRGREQIRAAATMVAELEEILAGA